MNSVWICLSIENRGDETTDIGMSLGTADYLLYPPDVIVMLRNF